MTTETSEPTPIAELEGLLAAGREFVPAGSPFAKISAVLALLAAKEAVERERDALDAIAEETYARLRQERDVARGQADELEEGWGHSRVEWAKLVQHEIARAQAAEARAAGLVERVRSGALDVALAWFTGLRIGTRSKLSLADLHDLAKAFAALATQDQPVQPRGEGDGWLPFATAPEDGTPIIVWRKDAGVFMAEFVPSLAAGDYLERTGDPCWFSFSGGEDLSDDLPTHWRPLPTPPTAPLAGGE